MINIQKMEGKQMNLRRFLFLNNTSKGFLLVFVLAFLVESAFGQSSPGGVSSDLNLWLKADAGTGTTTDGASITTWTDQSSSTNNGSSTSPWQPTYQSDAASLFNFHPVTRFDGVDDEIEWTTRIGTDNFTMIAVAKTSQTHPIHTESTSGTVGREANLNYIFGPIRSAADRNNPGAGISYATNGLSGYEEAYGYSPPLAVYSASLGSQGNIVGSKYNAKTPTLYVDGRDVRTGLTSTRTIVYGPDGLSTYSARFEGDIAEAIVFSRTIGATEHQQVDSYLALKYGITLDQTMTTDYLASDGTTTMWSAADNVGYTNDIFGVGRDDLQGLYQKVSKSSNPDAVVTIALDSDFSSLNNDPARIATIPNNHFLTIANNGGGANWLATGVPTGTNLIFERRWKVDETGTIGNVHIQFDVENAEFDIPGNFINLFLVVDSDNDGDLSDESPMALTNTSGSLWSTTVNFADGALFTLAVNNVAPHDLTLSLSKISEHSSGKVGDLSALDINMGDTHTYTLVSGTGDEDNGKFTISGTELHLMSSLDFESPTDLGDTPGNNTYSLRIQTDDGNGGLFQKTVIVTVLNSNDETPDLIRHPSFGSVHVFDTTPIASTSTAFRANNGWYNIADIDGDGDLDVLSHGGSGAQTGAKDIVYYENKGDSDSDGFINFDYHLVGSPNSLAAATFMDMDGDGDLDLYYSNRWNTNAVRWFKNNGGASGNVFAATSIIVDNQRNHYGNHNLPSVGDINGDGRPDVLVRHNGTHSGDTSIEWFELNADLSTYTTHTIRATSTQNASLFDVDTDGDLDVVLEGSEWIENIDGSGTFAATETATVIDERIQISTDIDLNNDGLMDAVGGTSVFLRTAPSSFTKATVFTAYPGIIQISKALDFDGDGDLDLMYGNQWAENDGDGNFTIISESKLSYGGATTTDAGKRYFVGDVDGDGRNDIGNVQSYFPNTTGDANYIFDQGDAAIGIFENVEVNHGIQGSLITSLSFTVSEVLNSTDEKINFFGSSIALDTAASTTGTTLTGGHSYTTTPSGGDTVVVTLSFSGGGISSSDLEIAIEAITYQNDAIPLNFASGRRSVAFNSLSRSGSGTSTNTSTVTSYILSDGPPFIDLDPSNTYSEDYYQGASSAGTVGVTYSLDEPGDDALVTEATNILTQLEIAVSFTAGNDGASEILIVNTTDVKMDGSDSFPLTINDGTTDWVVTYTAGIFTFKESDGMGGTMNTTDTKVQTLVRTLSYRNDAALPAEGNRVFAMTVTDGTSDTNADLVTGHVATAHVIINNTPPTLDLDTGTTGVNYDTDVDGTSVALGVSLDDITDSAFVVEGSDSIDQITVTITGVVNGALEQVTLDVDQALNADFGPVTGVTFAGTIIDYSYVSNVLTVTKAGGGPFTVSETQALIRALSYKNTAAAVIGGDRTFTFVLRDLSLNNSVVATATISTISDSPPPMRHGKRVINGVIKPYNN